MSDGEKREGLVRMVEELDEMERSVTSSEADFLDKMLTTLRAGRDLNPKDRTNLIAMHDKYFGDGLRKKKPVLEADDDIDPDDFA